MVEGMIKTGILILLLAFSSVKVIAQNSTLIRITVKDCTDNVPLLFAHVKVQQNDSILARQTTDERGICTLPLPLTGTYRMTINYFYYPEIIQEIHTENDTLITICLTATNPDSLLENYRFKEKYTLYYFGIPVFTEEELNKTADKYGVRYFNPGCVSNQGYEKYNYIIRKLLMYKLGTGWETHLFEELEAE